MGRSSRRNESAVCLLCYLLLLGVMLYSALQLWLFYEEDQRAAAVEQAVLYYKPEEANAVQGVVQNTGNPSLLALQEKYPDVVGWLSIPKTKIDYPFVQGEDNSYYLHRDLDGNPQAAGTIFMDYRNKLDCSNENIILYGHAMKNGSMFGQIKKFRNERFWKEASIAYLYLPNKTIKIQLLACLLVKADDTILYNPMVNKAQLWERLRSKALHVNEGGFSEAPQWIVLSTCSYDYEDARLVLLGALQED